MSIRNPRRVLLAVLATAAFLTPAPAAYALTAPDEPAQDAQAAEALNQESDEVSLPPEDTVDQPDTPSNPADTVPEDKRQLPTSEEIATNDLLAAEIPDLIPRDGKVWLEFEPNRLFPAEMLKASGQCTLDGRDGSQASIQISLNQADDFENYFRFEIPLNEEGIFDTEVQIPVQAKPGRYTVSLTCGYSDFLYGSIQRPLDIAGPPPNVEPPIDDDDDDDDSSTGGDDNDNDNGQFSTNSGGEELAITGAGDQSGVTLASALSIAGVLALSLPLLRSHRRGLS